MWYDGNELLFLIGAALAVVALAGLALFVVDFLMGDDE